MESYTIGRENFGMEKDFIVEVVQSCPSPACRYYKGHMGVGSFMDQSFSGSQINPEYLNHLQQLSASNASAESNQNSNNQNTTQAKVEIIYIYIIIFKMLIFSHFFIQVGEKQSSSTTTTAAATNYRSYYSTAE